MTANRDQRIISAYEADRDLYAELGVDTEAATRTLRSIPISLHCRQANECRWVRGAGLDLEGGGIQATGSVHGDQPNHHFRRGRTDERSFTIQVQDR